MPGPVVKQHRAAGVRVDTLIELWGRLRAGGVYMLPIFLVCVTMCSLIVHRLASYRDFTKAIRKSMKEPLNACALGSPLYPLAVRYTMVRTGNAAIDGNLREQLGKSLLRQAGTGGGGVLVCSALATLLGLLGTVSGMIVSFESMYLMGTSSTKYMASGISEALVTTQSGLLVGVAGLIAGRMLVRMGKNLHTGVQAYCRRLEQYIQQNARSEHAA